MSNCDHVSKVLEWGYKLIDGNVDEYASLWGCTKCDATGNEPFPSVEIFADHSACDDEPCFGCKAKGLQINTGDVNSRVIQSTRAHDKELGSYFDAVRQGIEPISTKKKDIDKAVQVSNDAGKAFDANTL